MADIAKTTRIESIIDFALEDLSTWKAPQSLKSIGHCANCSFKVVASTAAVMRWLSPRRRQRRLHRKAEKRGACCRPREPAESPDCRLRTCVKA